MAQLVCVSVPLEHLGIHVTPVSMATMQIQLDIVRVRFNVNVVKG